MDREQLRELRRDLNEPIGQQFLDYLKNPFSTGVDSTQFSRPVWDVIGDYVGPTLVLLLTATRAVRRHRHRDRHQGRLEARQHASTARRTGVTLTLYAMPEFWLGMVLLILFSTGVGPFPGIFPSGGDHHAGAGPDLARGPARPGLAPRPAGRRR